MGVPGGPGPLHAACLPAVEMSAVMWLLPPVLLAAAAASEPVNAKFIISYTLMTIYQHV